MCPIFPPSRSPSRIILTHLNWLLDNHWEPISTRYLFGSSGSMVIDWTTDCSTASRTRWLNGHCVYTQVKPRKLFQSTTPSTRLLRLATTAPALQGLARHKETHTGCRLARCIRCRKDKNIQVELLYLVLTYPLELESVWWGVTETVLHL